MGGVARYRAQVCNRQQTFRRLRTLSKSARFLDIPDAAMDPSTRTAFSSPPSSPGATYVTHQPRQPAEPTNLYKGATITIDRHKMCPIEGQVMRVYQTECGWRVCARIPSSQNIDGNLVYVSETKVVLLQ